MTSHYIKSKETEIESWLQEEFGYEKFKEGNESPLEIALREYAKGIKERNLKIITIAGTNGKGETAYSLSSLLQNKEISHTLWISPHILTIRERFSHDGKKISYDLLLSVLKDQKKKCEKLNLNLSYYEFLFCAFLNYTLNYLKNPPECIILEVGLGGRLDAVNYLDADLAIITSISRDHEDLLGKHYRNILYEKFGISRPNCPLITSLELKYCQGLVSKWSADKKVEWHDLFINEITTKKDFYSRRNQNLAIIASLFVKHQLLSHKKVIKDLSCIKDQFKEIQSNFNFPVLAGRLEEWIIGQSKFSFSGTHNLDGLRKLLEFLKENNKKFQIILVAFSKRINNEEKWMLKMIKEFAEESDVYLTEFGHFKASKIDSFFYPLSETHEFSSINRIKDWKKLLSSLKDNSKNVLVTGSFYFVGEVQKYFLVRDTF